MPTKNELLQHIDGIPEDRKHRLLLRLSMGALFPRGTGTTPVLVLVGEMHAWHLPAMELQPQQSLLLIDASQLPALKRTIDRLLAQMEQGQFVEDLPEEQKSSF